METQQTLRNWRNRGTTATITTITTITTTTITITTTTITNYNNKEEEREGYSLEGTEETNTATTSHDAFEAREQNEERMVALFTFVRFFFRMSPDLLVKYHTEGRFKRKITVSGIDKWGQGCPWLLRRHKWWNKLGTKPVRLSNGYHSMVALTFYYSLDS